MELANIKYITHNGKSLFEESCIKVPKYGEIKTLKPVIVDDFLMLSRDIENIALLSDYIKKNYLFVPIRRVNKSKQEAKSFPSRILLEITSKCNLNCTMCPRNYLKRPEMHMPKEVVLRCIDEIDHYGVEGIWLYNIGESALHPDFKEIFEYCQTKKRLGSLWLSTNGQELSDEIMDMLVNSNLTFLNYSVNAMNEQTYELVSPKGNYRRLISNLEKLLAKKKEHTKMGSTPWVRIQMIDQPQAFFEIDSLQRADCFIFSNGEVSFCDTDFNGVNSLGNIFSSTIQEVWSRFERIKELNLEGKIEDLPLCKNCLDWDL